MNDTEHLMTVESTQIFHGQVEPSQAELLTSDGTSIDAYGRERTNEGVELDFHDEVKLTFECTCGDRFRKPETAREHLEDVRSTTENDRGEQGDE